MKLLHIEGPYPYCTNTFVLVSNAGHAVVIDPAASLETYITALQNENARLAYVFLTHGHGDHLASAEALAEQTGAALVLHADDARQFGIAAARFYADGETFIVDDIAINVLFTPGHTLGSVCLCCADLLFSGDTLFAGDVGRTDLEGGDFDTLNRSLARLAKEAAPALRVLPGHGAFSTMKDELAHNPYLRAAL